MKYWVKVAHGIRKMPSVISTLELPLAGVESFPHGLAQGHISRPAGGANSNDRVTVAADDSLALVEGVGVGARFGGSDHWASSVEPPRDHARSHVRLRLIRGGKAGESRRDVVSHIVIVLSKRAFEVEIGALEEGRPELVGVGRSGVARCERAVELDRDLFRLANPPPGSGSNRRTS